MLSVKQLIVAGKEMQALMGLNPKFDPEAPTGDIVEWVKTAVKEINPKIDRFTPETQVVIDTINGEDSIHIKDPAAESETTPVEESFENNDLLSEIKNAERLRDLKDIATEYEEFKPIRGKLSSYKTAAELKTAMLSLTGTEKQKDDVKEEPAPATTPAAVKKSVSEEVPGKTKFGHRFGSQAGEIDEILLKAKTAQTISEIAAKLKAPEIRIKSHITHLIKDKAVSFEVTDGKYLLKCL
jgi:hypothetical protein